MPFPAGTLRQAIVQQAQGTLITKVVWDFSPNAGEMVDSYNPTADNAAPVPVDEFQTNGAPLSYHWRSPGDFPFREDTTFNTQNQAGLHSQSNGTESVCAPAVTSVVAQAAHFRMWTPENDPVVMLSGNPGPGFEFTCVVTLNNVVDGGGQAACFQTVKSSRSYTRNDDVVISMDTDGFYCLDTTLPYEEAVAGAAAAALNLRITDGPYMWLPPHGFKQVVMQDDFTINVMYQSSRAGSIWVSLGKLSWRAYIHADKAGDAAPWVLSLEDTTVGAWAADHNLPAWNGNITTVGQDFHERLEQQLPAGVQMPVGLQWTGVTTAAGKRFYAAQLNTWPAADLRNRLQAAVGNLIGPYRPAPMGYFLWTTPDRVAAVQQVAGVNQVYEPAATERYPQPKGGRTPDFANEKEYYVSVAPLCWATSDFEESYWRSETPVGALGLQTQISQIASPITAVFTKASGYGRFLVQFSSAPGEAVIRSVAGLTWVQSIELKQHFSPGPGPVGPIFI